MVLARTLDGDLGVLPNHAPLLGVLVDGKVKVKAVDGTEQDFDIHGGFISVANNRVSILGEDRKSTRLNSSHSQQSRMPSSA